MSVQYVKSNNGILGTLGALATLGGTLTGAGWLTSLGAGLGGLNSVLNGGNDESSGQSGLGGLGDFLRGILGPWKKPTDGNISKMRNPILDAAGLTGAYEDYKGEGKNNGWQW